MKKVELLAPAGNYESFLGAVHAGADAVYLGGNRFGARAYADNFTQEEVIKAIRYAHIHGRKIYLTLNTLIKEREFHEIHSFLKPFYEYGLDGVIIQDLGVFCAVGEWFPDLERHISTQMTVTGSYGAAFLKKLGAVRIVPARELSLHEIRQIKKTTDIEVETFVHGAICYCYSGQCLFSSILGGRSGNRGRCAQPCRLPYKINACQDTGSAQSRQQYPLSLKDMCTIELLPELIEAGIDSFKIEGRMKSPEYSAGVTSVYRKYIDSYYSNQNAGYKVEHADMATLRSLYIRSETSSGYYYRHNGKEMLTLETPGYAGKDEALTAEIRDRFLEADFRLPITGRAFFAKGKRAEYTIQHGGCLVSAYGEVVQEAQKQPLTESQILKQLKKNGNSPFALENITVNREENVFMPVKALNDLRRKACEMLEMKIIERNNLSYPERKEWKEISGNKKNSRIPQNAASEAIHVLVSGIDQLNAALDNRVERIYVSSGICTDGTTVKPWKNSPELYMALPYIFRERDRLYFQKLRELLETEIFSGVLARNLEELEWLRDTGYSRNIVTDQNLYIWNKKACDALNHTGQEHYISCELNYHEIRELTEQAFYALPAISIYGRIPMMISANCAGAAGGNCKHKSGYLFLTDRYHKIFPVYLDCNHCYNVIYNSLPLSLHQNMNQLKSAGINTFRLDFTTETGYDVDRIIKYFRNQIISDTGSPPYKDYTKGHFKRGAE